MKKSFYHKSLLKGLILIFILTLLVSCNNEAGALTQNSPDESAIPQELVGQWEIMDSYSTEKYSVLSMEVDDLEILDDGTVLFSTDPDYGFNVIVVRLKVLSGDRLLIYNPEGVGDVVFFNSDENELKLSRGDDSYLFRRKDSN